MFVPKRTEKKVAPSGQWNRNMWSPERSTDQSRDASLCEAHVSQPTFDDAATLVWFSLG